MQKLLILGLAVAFTSVAFGQNLLTNPGFETGTASTGTPPTGWNVIASTGISDYFTETGTVHGGVQALALEAFGTPLQDDSFYQDIATTAGAHYTYTMYAFGNSSPQEVTFTWNNTVLFQGATPNSVWTQYTFDVVATSATSRFEFGGYNSPSGNYVDDASLVAVTAPEPASMSILGVGFLALLRRRRAAKK